MSKIKDWCKEHKKLVSGIVALISATGLYLTGDADMAATMEAVMRALEAYFASAPSVVS